MFCALDEANKAQAYQANSQEHSQHQHNSSAKKSIEHGQAAAKHAQNLMPSNGKSTASIVLLVSEFHLCFTTTYKALALLAK